VQEARHIGHRFGARVALEHTQKHRLENVFRIVGVAGNVIRRPEYHGVVLTEDLFQVRGGRFGRFHGGSHQRFHRIRLFQ
jgi:hypothetical protein